MKNNEENRINKLTIVGGQVSEKNSPYLFSTHIEKILIKAASDEAFRKELTENRKNVLEKEDLDPTDKILLGTIPLKQLNNMIDKFSGYRSSRREFLKGAAASAAFLTSAFVFQSAEASDTKEEQLMTQTITSEGGNINCYTGLNMIIPPGAVNENVDITITTIANPVKLDKGSYHVYTYRFYPKNFIFLKEIIISFPFMDYDTSVYAYYIEDNKLTEIKPATIFEYSALIKINKLGTYMLGYYYNGYEMNIPQTQGIRP